MENPDAHHVQPLADDQDGSLVDSLGVGFLMVGSQDLFDVHTVDSASLVATGFSAGDEGSQPLAGDGDEGAGDKGTQAGDGDEGGAGDEGPLVGDGDDGVGDEGAQPSAGDEGAQPRDEGGAGDEGAQPLAGHEGGAGDEGTQHLAGHGDSTAEGRQKNCMEELLFMKIGKPWEDLWTYVQHQCLNGRQALAYHASTACQPQKQEGPAGSLITCGFERGPLAEAFVCT